MQTKTKQPTTLGDLVFALSGAGGSKKTAALINFLIGAGFIRLGYRRGKL